MEADPLDILFAKLRNMQFNEAIDEAIKLGETLPLGTSAKDRITYVDQELSRFGWSYERLVAEHRKTIAGIRK